MNKNVETIELTADELPAYCPNIKMDLKSSHPRVFIDTSKGHGQCPYCSTQYKLKDGVNPGHH